MPSPKKTIANFQRICLLNAEHQAIEWLRYANHASTETGECWSIKQGDSRIELHSNGQEALLLLWMPGEPTPPMDNVKPQWDATSMVQDVLSRCEEFPHAIAWASNLHNADWLGIWLATQWWPTEGHTDAVDDPLRWISWWWTDIMEFTTAPPSLYDNQIT